jgi:hypothetical protein
MSFIYPRTIAITRPVDQAGEGAVGYGGTQNFPETPVVSDVPASIQYAKSGMRPSGNIPDDIDKKTFWNIFFRLPEGIVNARDIITDDLGVRYQVNAPYWNSLGYKITAERLDT